MTRPRGQNRRTDDRAGFVLMLVVLMLFTIAIAAATGYQIVQAEFSLAVDNRDGQQALTVAHAGLQRFLGEQIGEMGDTIRYAIGSGVATITTRMLYQQDASNHLYYVRSEGTVGVPAPPGGGSTLVVPDRPARRAVAAYAWHRIAPLPQRAMILVMDSTFQLENEGALLVGEDASDPSDCDGGGLVDVLPIATRSTLRAFEEKWALDSDMSAVSPEWEGTAEEYYNTHPARAEEVVDDLWATVSDPQFPVDYVDQAPPYWQGLPEDSFPVLRFSGSLKVDGTSRYSGGRGTLIVSDWLGLGDGFEWDGLIMAGRLAQMGDSDAPTIRGMLVVGLPDDGSGIGQTSGGGQVELRGGRFQYDFCKARAANRGLSYIEAVDNRVFEVGY